jgi:hypothetical protein
VSAGGRGVLSGPRSRRNRGRLRLTRLRAVVVLTLLLALGQVLFEEVLLFLATAGGGVSGPLASPLVAVGVPLAIATTLLVLLVGGALWADRASATGRARLRPDPDDEGDAER